MLLAIIGCVLGIVVESVKWPQDRRKALDRLVAAEGTPANVWYALGLALGHPVVRWIIALALAGWLVALVLGSPPVLGYVKSAIDAHHVSVNVVDLLTGIAWCAVMTVLAIGARLVAR